MTYYKASDVVKRALQLADLSNTDFLSHNELKAYLADAWTAVYQALINKGCKVFIKETSLKGASINNTTDYKLPDDLWQICSIKTRTGNWIPRKSESENNSSGTYEIFNDTLRLYGTSSDLILSYWTKPVDITLPNKTQELDDLLTKFGRDIVATYDNKVAIRNNNTLTVIDVVSKEIITQVNIDDDINDILLTQDYYCLERDDKWELYDNNDLIDSRDAKDYSKVNSNCRYNLANDTQLYDIENDELIDHIEGNVRAVYAYNDDLYILYDDKRLSVINEDRIEIVLNELDYDINSAIVTDAGILINNKDLITLPDGNIYSLTIPTVYRGIKYGYLHKSLKRLVSSEIDTIFDFPNDLFVSAIAYQLAMSMTAKQNANNEGLKSAYDQAVITLMNTLDQSGGYTRIVNIY